MVKAKKDSGAVKQAVPKKVAKAPIAKAPKKDVSAQKKAAAVRAPP